MVEMVRYIRRKVAAQGLSLGERLSPRNPKSSRLQSWIAEREGTTKSRPTVGRRRVHPPSLSVKLYLRDGRTDGRRDATRLFVRVSSSVRPSVRSFVRSSFPIVRCVCQGRPSCGENEPRCFIEI